MFGTSVCVFLLNHALLFHRITWAGFRLRLPGLQMSKLRQIDFLRWHLESRFSCFALAMNFHLKVRVGRTTAELRKHSMPGTSPEAQHGRYIPRSTTWQVHTPKHSMAGTSPEAQHGRYIPRRPAWQVHPPKHKMAGTYPEAQHGRYIPRSTAWQVHTPKDQHLSRGCNWADTVVMATRRR